MPDPSHSRPAEGVHVAETGAGRFEVEVSAGGARFMADEPTSVGGLGSGPNPYDLLGAALGACTAMTLRLYARRKAWPLERVEVGVVHARAEGGDVFTREIALTGPLDEAQRAGLLAIADRCPVHLTLERGAQVQTRLAERLAPIPDAAGSQQHMRDMDRVCEG